MVPVENPHAATQAVRPAVQFDGQRADAVRAAPLLNEHGAAIRARWRSRRWPNAACADLRGSPTTLRRTTQMLFPTTLVGSYPQPEWLIDRKKLAGRFPPRVRAKELWRVPEQYLEEAQDDATLLAIRAQEEAGLDIITDGEIRRESYSNRFATALDGVDLDNPGTALDRSGHPNPVPRVTGPIRRQHAVDGRRPGVPARATPTRRVKITVPGPFTMSQQAQIDHYGGSREQAALDYAHGRERGDPRPVRRRRRRGADRRALHAGAPRRGARSSDSTALNARARRRHRHDGRAHLLRLCRDHPRAAVEGYSFLTELAGCSCQQISHRDRAVEPRLQRARRRCRASRSCSASSTSRTMTVETPETVAARIRRALPYVPRGEHHRRAGLRNEVPAARSG